MKRLALIALLSLCGCGGKGVFPPWVGQPITVTNVVIIEVHEPKPDTYGQPAWQPIPLPLWIPTNGISWTNWSYTNLPSVKVYQNLIQDSIGY